MLAKDLSAMLAKNAYEVASMLFPNGKKQGKEWCVGSLRGEAGDSLKIHLTGDKAGIWGDFHEGPKGDLLDLWALKYGISISEAMRDVCKYLNLPKLKASYSGSKKVFVKPPRIDSKPLSHSTHVYAYLSGERGLNPSVIALYAIPDSDHEIIFNYFRDSELIFVKTLKLERKNGSKQMFVSPNAEPCLFGWDLIPKTAREVVICEGEIDAMSFYQYGIPALSVPFGGGAGDKQRWIEYEYDRLNRFDELLICMDGDEAGSAGAKEIIARLGAHRCKLVTLPMKDANECLVNGISAHDIKFFLKEAKPLDPQELCRHDVFTDAAYEIISPTPDKFLGYQLGWNKLNDNILFKPSGLSMWTGYNGHGKTLFLGQVMLNLITQGARICVASMELFPEELMARMYMQATALEKPSRKFVDKIDEWLSGKLYIFNLVGTAKIDRMLEVLLYARRRYGIDVFIVDSLSTLSIADDDYSGQKELTEKLRDFKIEYNCHIHLVTHPRKPKDESIIPGKYDISGAGAISNLADNCFSICRNKEKEDVLRKQDLGRIITPTEVEVLKKADSYFRCDKNRHGRGKFKEGTWGFWFHEPSGQYLERAGQKPTPFIEYSCLNES